MVSRYGFVLVLAGLCVTPAVAQEVHSSLCLYGCPSGSPVTNDLIIREIYVLSSNDETKFADWVAYKVTKSTIGPTAERKWKADPLLAENETLEPKDYKGAWAALKVDRGHQAPLASFTSTSHWETTNYLSNITPQKSALNQGPWVRLENAVRALAKKPEVNAVFVMTGPLYEREMPALPKADESHRVPSGYWKIIAVKTGKKIATAAFQFTQETARKADYCAETFITSIRTIEGKTGLNFFHALGKAKQDTVEKSPATLLPKLGCLP